MAMSDSERGIPLKTLSYQGYDYNFENSIVVFTKVLRAFLRMQELS